MMEEAGEEAKVVADATRVWCFQALGEMWSRRETGTLHWHKWLERASAKDAPVRSRVTAYSKARSLSTVLYSKCEYPSFTLR